LYLALADKPTRRRGQIAAQIPSRKREIDISELLPDEEVRLLHIME